MLSLHDASYSAIRDEQQVLAEWLEDNGIYYYIMDDNGDDAYVINFEDIDKIEPCYNDEIRLTNGKHDIELAFVKKIEVLA